jgi:hypothetical protein
MAKRIDTTVTPAARRRIAAKRRAAKARPTIGAENASLIASISSDLAPLVRGTGGIAHALVELYNVKLTEAEAEYERLGRQTTDGAAFAYRQQGERTQELRGLVAILTTLASTLEPAA